MFPALSKGEEAVAVKGHARLAFAGPHEAFATVVAKEEVGLLREEGEWTEVIVRGKRAWMPSAFVKAPRNAWPRPCHYEPVARLLVADKRLVGVLVQVVKPTAAEKVGKQLLALYGASGQEAALLTRCIESEVEACTSVGTLFRRNSINSVALAAYARREAGPYLVRVLQPTLDKVAFGNEGYEIDPGRLDSGSSLPSHVANVEARVRELLTLLVESADEIPPGLAFTCSKLAKTVAAWMPEASRNVAVGGFLMLRFICPALAASSEADGLPTVPAKRRRGLVLVSKVLINLVNDVEFGKKEPYMAPFEQSLRADGLALLSSYFDRVIAVSCADYWLPPPLRQPVVAPDSLVEPLHRFLTTSLIDMPAQVQEQVQEALRDSTAAVTKVCRLFI